MITAYAVAEVAEKLFVYSSSYLYFHRIFPWLRHKVTVAFNRNILLFPLQGDYLKYSEKAS